MLFVGGHDLIVLLYTKAYEASASIFLVSIFLLLIGIFLLDPIVRAYKGLRNFLLGVRIGVFIALFCVLGPAIRHFGMMGAAVTAVVAQVFERFIIAWGTARTVEAKARDIRLYADLFKVTGVTLVAGAAAYFVRNLIPATMLVPRILAAGLVVAAIYVPAMFALRLPGWEMFTKDRLLSLAKSTLGRLRSATA